MNDLESVPERRPADPRRALAWIIALSMLLRVAAVLYLGNSVTPLPGTYDQISYDALGQRLTAGHGFSFGEPSWPATRAGEPTAHWSFLYSGFLAAVYALVGHQPLAARLLQAVLVGVLLPYLTWALARRTVGERPALWAATIAATYVYFVYYSATLMTEMFTIVAVLAMLVLTADLAERPSWRRWAIWGVVIAAAALLRQVTLAVVPVLALWLIWRARGHARAAVAGVALSGVVAVACLVPVTIRNWRAFDRFVAVNTNAGYAFFWANHPIHGTDFQGILPAEGPSYQALIPDELRALDEAALNDALLARGIGYVTEAPGRYAVLSLSRLEDYFLLWPKVESSRISNLSRVLSFGIWLPFMIAGLVLARNRWRACAPCYLFVLVYTLVHLLSWALVRYRLPVDAVLIVFAGLAVDRMVAALPWRVAGRSPAAAVP